MNSDIEQTVYLLGLLSGLQSMTNDINSGGAVNVPKILRQWSSAA